MRWTLLLAAIAVMAVAARAQRPPIIDRELFFGDPDISGAQISPDAAFVTFLKPFKGVRNIWIKPTAAPFDAAHPITADTTRPVGSYFWSHDSKFVLYAQDKGGDENYRIYAVDPRAAGDPVPPARDLTPLPKVRAMIIDVPRSSPGELLVGLNDRRPDLHDVYRVVIATGERTLVRKNDQNVVGWQPDLTGTLRVALRQTPSGGMEMLRVEKDTLIAFYEVTADETINPVEFLPDGKRFYFITNKGDVLDKAELQIYDLTTGTTSTVDRDPLGQVDISNVMTSDITHELLATFYVGDRTRVYPKQKQFAADWAKLQKAVPKGEISIGSMTADENLWVVAVSSDTDPGSRYLFNRKTGKATLLYRSRPNLPSQHLARVTPVRYPARDGMEIPAYLVLPKGVPAKDLPAVMLIHGGPWSRVYWGYTAEAQFLANRGYAVLVPNFRGSTGYGKTFLNAGNGQWGTGSMQHDITDGVKYLVARGIADPKKVAIYGGSYGGYATLAGLAFTPELYAAGISYVGPSNIITLLKSIPPYWAPMKRTFAIRVGDIENPTDVKRLEAQSPLNSSRHISAPLLVVQGANDPRVKKAESDQIVVAMRDLHRPVEYMVAPDEGHGFAGRENRLAMYTAMERFFAKHLGGRVQEAVPTEIARKLEALTVDVSTVTLPVAPAEPPAPRALFSGGTVKPGTAKFLTQFSAMGQKISMNTTRTITAITAQGAALWRIVDESSGMMGTALDTLDVDATTLAAIARGSAQGGSTVALRFTAGGVKGSMVARGTTLPVDVKTDGPVISDGAGIELAVAALPLAAGYRGSTAIFDLMARKVRPYTITVTGKEQATTSGGAVDAWVIDVKPTDGESGAMKFWVSVSAPQVVRSEMELPAQMGGGKVVTELVK